MRTVPRGVAIPIILAVPLVFSSCGDGGGGTGPGSDPRPETLASFALTVPDSISEGESFSLTVTALGNRGANPLTSFSGAVALGTSLGTITPSSLSVASGSGTAQVTLSTPGQQTLTASGGGRTGSLGVDVTDLPDPPIPGDPNATLEQAVPDSVYVPDPNDYSDDHPDLPGIYLSHNVALMAFAVGTTVQQANELLTPLGGQLVGGIQGVSGTVPSIVIARLATGTHAEMEAALTTLRASPIVLHAAQDGALSHDALPEYTWWTPDEWIWEWVQPAGGNWGMELIRVPQMWNLNRAVGKVDPTVWTGVMDSGFDGAHADFSDRPAISLDLGYITDHGTHVAGIIGADFWNGLGVEGVNPFSGIVFLSSASVGIGSGMVWRASWGATITGLILRMATHSNEPVVINMSLGYNWAAGGIDTNTSAAAQTIAETHGAVLKTALDGLSIAQSLPIITASSGNDSNGGFGLQLARYNSPMCNAALAHGAANIFVVESVRYDADSPGESTRSDFSNIEGHLSAPGSEVLSTTPGNGVRVFSGTSMAAPHVAGLVGYMLAIDPTLTIPQIRNALVNTSIPVGDFASNRIDAWAAVMEIDQVQGGNTVLKRMADIDDGTLDGNRRVWIDSLTFPDNDSIDADGDGGLGDGRVDMSDFRVWRDWFLKIDGVDSDHFDGRADHPKMDVNDNGVTEDDAGESLFPRGDFNGDGILSLEDSARVGGAVQDSLSDLDVFKLVFDDPDYDKDALDTLVYSSDITVDASIAFQIYATPPITAGVWKRGPFTGYRWVTLTQQEPRAVFTVKSVPEGWNVWVREGDINSERFADSSYGPLARWVGTDAVMWPIRPFQVDVKSTFLTSCDDAGATTAQAISLASLQLQPGDHLFMDGAGTWPPVKELVAVFSGSDQIEEVTEPAASDPSKTVTRRTVTDAIALGGNLLGGNTYNSPPTQECGGVPTDIPEDFTPFQVSFVRIPDGATHLILGMGSAYYSDNEPQDDPIRVEISKWYAPEWHDMTPPAPSRTVGRRR